MGRWLFRQDPPQHTSPSTQYSEILPATERREGVTQDPRPRRSRWPHGVASLHIWHSGWASKRESASSVLPAYLSAPSPRAFKTLSMREASTMVAWDETKLYLQIWRHINKRSALFIVRTTDFTPLAIMKGLIALYSSATKQELTLYVPFLCHK